jgi:hypothetical protein
MSGAGLNVEPADNPSPNLSSSMGRGLITEFLVHKK